MAIIAGLMSIVGRFAGQVLNMTLGWATILLFGKVPQKKQFVLLILVFGSLVWVALVVGVIVPDVGSVVIAAVPVSPFVDVSWMRMAMLASAIGLPLAIGMAAVSVTTPESRPRGLGIARGRAARLSVRGGAGTAAGFAGGRCHGSQAALDVQALGRRARAGHRQARPSTRKCSRCCMRSSMRLGCRPRRVMRER